ncbi:MAG: chemotaxis response regulator protein-glutamate methylesterase [Desulfurivibrionaceae bacterium]
MSIKVMVVDDTIFYRKIVGDLLAEIDGVEMVGTANNGKIALNKIRSLKPDLLTLDVEMPIMSGLELMEEINRQDLDVGCIMLSAKTQKGSEATMRALELGAFDFISKPDNDSAEENIKAIKTELDKLIKGFIRHRRLRGEPGEKPAVPKKPAVTPRPAKPLKRTEKSLVVALGISTGGPNSLLQVLPELPGDIGVPILLVQHMPPIFTASLAQSLDRKCALKVKEAEDQEKVEANTVYIAPGGKQMKVASGAGGLHRMIRITDDPPENNCRPSVDYLFRSVAREYGSKATCVIMTGMGSDGKQGMSVVKAAGSVGIAQDETSSVVYGMPKAVVDAGLVDIVASLDSMSQEISKTLQWHE